MYSLYLFVNQFFSDGFHGAGNDSTQSSHHLTATHGEKRSNRGESHEMPYPRGYFTKRRGCKNNDSPGGRPRVDFQAEKVMKGGARPYHGIIRNYRGTTVFDFFLNGTRVHKFTRALFGPYVVVVDGNLFVRIFQPFSLAGGSSHPQTRLAAPETPNRAFSAAVGSEVVKTPTLEVR